MRRGLLPVLTGLVLLAGCGGGGGSTGGAGGGNVLPVLRSGTKEGPRQPADLGFPGFATKNTTRVGGADPVTDAAGVALAVFPAQTRATRPPAVALADGTDWRGATAAAALVARPVRAPLLLSDGTKLPEASAAAVKALNPAGSDAAGGGQVIAVGRAPDVPGRKVTRVADKDPGPFALAGAIDRFLTAAQGKPSANVLVVSAARAEYGVPAAAWAAKSGDPVLFVTRTGVPAATARALRAHGRPRIYVLGPPSVVGAGALRALKRLGAVTRIAGPDPVRNAIAFARFNDGRFGWGITDPGHGLIFASARRPLDGPASAALASAGAHGPLLLLDRADRLPGALGSFLLDVQPGYRKDPVRGVYNHGWLIGDPKAISIPVQTQIDQALEITPVSLGR